MEKDSTIYSKSGREGGTTALRHKREKKKAALKQD